MSAPSRTFPRPVICEVPRPGAGRGAVWLLAGIATLATAWAAGTTWYILCKDEFAQTFLARQAEMRFAYEDRVTELKNRLEREITSGLVERKGFGARVDALTKRQAEIEARQLWLAGLTERAGGGAGVPASETTSFARLSSATPEATERPVGIPIPTYPSSGLPETGRTAAGPAKPAPIPVEPFDLRLREKEDTSPRLPDRLSAIEDSLRRMSVAAIASTDAVRRNARERAARVRQALESTRLAIPGPVLGEVPTGGPFIPATAGLDGAAFSPIAADAEAAIADLGRLGLVARSLPVGKPLLGDLEQTSSFGYRVDPFNRSAAVHSGVDFRAAHGAPVRATAAGRVVTADYTGGYGNMVEIEHEGGVSTRYGHLSGILVAPGQRVEAGQLVGRAGSTGRSTGTHLHYETRVEGEAVNPVRFLEAGRLLAAAR